MNFMHRIRKTKYVCETIILCVVLYRIKSGLLLKKTFGSVKDEIVCLEKFRFEVLNIVSVKSAMSWDVTPCSLVELYGYFGGTYCFHNQG
jgi:hypothetical protein